MEGKLIAAITTGTTTGILVKVKQVNGATPTWPTAAHRIKIVQKTATVTKVEKLGIAAGTTQSSQTVTLGTATRALSLSDGTIFTGSGTAQTFAAGADVFITWDNQDAALTAKTDLANTFTALNTFSSGVTLSGTTKTLTLPSMTTSQRDAIASPANGMVIYNSTTSVMNQYIGGAWTTFATGSVSNAADGSSGKVDLATAAEVAAGTATDASSGASNVIPVTIVKPTSTGAVSGSVVALNTSVAVDRTIGGLGTTSGTAYTLLANGTTSTAAAQSLAGVGTSLQVLTSNGASNLPTFQAVPGTSKTVYASAAASATLTNPTSVTNFDTHTYTIPANDFVAGVVYEIEGDISWTPASTYSSTVYLRLGSTSLATVDITSTGGSLRYTTFRGRLFGTAAAGASVAVNSDIIGTSVNVSAPASSNGIANANVATNGTLVLAIGFSFGTSNGANVAYLYNVKISKHSSTVF